MNFAKLPFIMFLPAVLSAGAAASTTRGFSQKAAPGFAIAPAIIYVAASRVMETFDVPGAGIAIVNDGNLALAIPSAFWF